MAMLLVIMALVLGLVLVLSFLSGQNTSTAVAANVNRHAQARAVAEAGLQLAIQHTQAQGGTWRADLGQGVWFTNQSIAGGTVTVSATDGQDLNGDGVIANPDEGDGDLSDDLTDPVTLIAVGTFEGVTHRTKAVVTGAVVVDSPQVLMVVVNPAALTEAEETRKTLIESWSWEVDTIAASASDEDYATALGEVHVVYVPEDGGSSAVGGKLADVELGVVYEDGDMNDELDLASGQTSFTGASIRIVDASHYITSPFGIGDLTIASANHRIEALSGSVAGSAQPLGWWNGTGTRVLAAMDVSKSLLSGNPAVGRRVFSPLSGFTAEELTPDGQNLLRRMLEWGAQSAQSTDIVEALTNWTYNNSIPIPAGEDRLLVVSIGAETHASITSITWGGQPLTLAASAYESTGVGARTYLYYLPEVNIAAASGSTLSTSWTSGTRDDTAHAARVYQNVNQSNPIRVTEWATNAGPSTISCAPMTVVKGDMVFSGVRVGMESRPYTWTSPLVEGVDRQMSTTSYTAADYAVPSGVTSVTAAASCSAPNRQAMVAAVIQARNLANGEGVIPVTLALYEFNETQPDVSLVGHFPLDDDGSGGSLGISSSISLYGNAVINGYRSSAGAYGGANTNQNVTLVTNTSSGNGIRLENQARIQGSTYNYPGANPTNVVNISGTASISGNRYEQSVAFTMPAMPATPTSFSYTYSGNYNLTSSYSMPTNYDRYRITGNFTLSNATLTITDDTDIRIDGDLTLNNNGRITVAAGKVLRLFVADDVTLSGNAYINSDTANPGRVEIYMTGGNSDLTMNDTSSISGLVHVNRNISMSSSPTLHGAVYCNGTLTMYDSSRISVDLSQVGLGIIPVADATDANPAQAHDSVSFLQAGARGFTNTSLRFDGSNDFVRIPNHDDYLLNHGSISFWFKSESLSGTRGLFSKDSADYDTGGHLNIYTSSSTLYARIQTNGSSPYGSPPGNDITVSAAGLSTNTWYHVVVTFGAGGLRLYLNGTLSNSADYPGGLGSSSGSIGNYQPLVLGASTDNSGDLTHLPLRYQFQGYLDDVRIFNGVLDATQVARVYAGNDPGDRSEPSYLVNDTSGLGTPLDLAIDNTAAVTWPEGGGLSINSATVLRAADSPDKIRNGIAATGEFSVEINATPSAISGAKRLLWYGPNTSTPTNTNLDLYQNGAFLSTRLRTSDTVNSPTAFTTGSTVLAQDQPYHLILTYGKDLLRIYIDNTLIAETPYTGTILNWDSAYKFSLANLPLGGDPFLGTLNRVVIYDRALNVRQIQNLIDGLPPGAGGDFAADAGIRWSE
jgi:hypothetical protein